MALNNFNQKEALELPSKWIDSYIGTQGIANDDTIPWRLLELFQTELVNNPLNFVLVCSASLSEYQPKPKKKLFSKGK